jgi:CheY-like chemotaxis protein
MTKPLAILLHERVIPGSQVAARFEELEYRVVTVEQPGALLETARREMPMIVVADLTNRQGDVLAAIAALRTEAATAHVPVVAYGVREDERQRAAARAAGVKVLATESTIVPHLLQFVEHALQLD